MKMLRKTIAIMMVAIMFLLIFESVDAEAKNGNATTEIPKFSVKTQKGSSCVKITIAEKLAGSEYEILISASPKNLEYCEYFKYLNSNGRVSMGEERSLTLKNQTGKKKPSVVIKDLQPGTYSVKVRRCSSVSMGGAKAVYDGKEWSKEKTFTLKEISAKGYSTSYDFSRVKKGDIIYFGSYEQDMNYSNGKEAIAWIVLEKNEDSMFLLSKYALERLPYNKEKESVTWEECSLRKWLNEYFISSAFNETEKDMLIFTEDNDKVSLLSRDDMTNPKYGFLEDELAEDINRRCGYAWYKYLDETWYGTPKTSEDVDSCWWWLRYDSSDKTDTKKSNVNALGKVNHWGNPVNDIDYINGYYGGNSAGVRPVIYVNLDTITS